MLPRLLYKLTQCGYHICTGPFLPDTTAHTQPILAMSPAALSQPSPHHNQQGYPLPIVTVTMVALLWNWNLYLTSPWEHSSPCTPYASAPTTY